MGGPLAGEGLVELLPALALLAPRDPTPCVGSQVGTLGRFVPQQPLHRVGHAAAGGTFSRPSENDLFRSPGAGLQETRNYSRKIPGKRHCLEQWNLFLPPCLLKGINESSGR